MTATRIIDDHTELANIGSLTHADIDAWLNQAVKTTSSPTFVDILIGQYLKHNGDTNTYIKFTGDQIDFYTGGMWMLSLDESSQDKVIFNPGRRNIDFRVDGDAVLGAIYVDANHDMVHFDGGMGYQPKHVTANYSCSYADHMIYCTGTLTVTLPAISYEGQEIIIVNRGGAATITVEGNHGEHINHSLTQTLGTLYDSITVVSDKYTSEWYIISDTR